MEHENAVEKRQQRSNDQGTLSTLWKHFIENAIFLLSVVVKRQRDEKKETAAAWPSLSRYLVEVVKCRMMKDPLKR
jgi:hypothetical protein